MSRRKPTSMTGDSEIALVAQQIRAAAEFLVKQHDYRLEHLRNITAGGNKDGKLANGRGVKRDDRLHKNCLMKIKDLRVGWAVLRVVDKSGRPLDPATVAQLSPEQLWKYKRHWVEAPYNAVGVNNSPGRWQWMWNPQVDTFEKLERIITEACALGFEPDARLSLHRAVKDAA